MAPSRRSQRRSPAAKSGGARSGSRRAQAQQPEQAPARPASRRPGTRQSPAKDPRPASGRAASANSAASKPSSAKAQSSRRAPVSERTPTATNRHAPTRQNKASRPQPGSANPVINDEAADRVSARRAATRKMPAHDGVNDRASRRRGQTQSSSNLKSYALVGLFLAAAIIGITFVVMWPGMKREMVLERMDQAQGADAIAIADEYLNLVEFNAGRVQTALGQKRGPIEAQIHLANELNLTNNMVLIALRPDNDITPAGRAQALEAAAALIDKGRDTTTTININRLQEWALQPDAENIDVALARGAAHLIAAIGEEKGSEILSGAIQDAGQNPEVVDAAIEYLPAVVGRGNVGYAIDLINGPNGHKVRNSEPLMAALANTVQAAHLDRVFNLLDHADPEMQAAGARLLRGNGVRNATLAERESVGRRLAPYLSTDMRDEKPQVFKEALQAVRDVSLTGARDAVLALLPHVDPGHADAEVLATILGSVFVRKGDEFAATADETVAGLAKAVTNASSRTTAARALGLVQVKDLPASRRALEACAEYGEDPDCMAAMHQIVAKLFQRTDVSQKLQEDANAWRTFLAQDRPRYEQFMTINEFIIEYSDIRATDDSQRIDTAWTTVQEHMNLIAQWTSASGEPMPLGLTKPMVETAQQSLNTLKYSIQKAKH